MADDVRKKTAGSLEQLLIDPSQRVAIDNTSTQFQQASDAFADQARRAAGQVQANFGQFNPGLNTNFQGPQFGNQLDSFSNFL
jgi:hypothetical protein